jgi:hypothetical protein
MDINKPSGLLALKKLYVVGDKYIQTKITYAKNRAIRNFNLVMLSFILETSAIYVILMYNFIMVVYSVLCFAIDVNRIYHINFVRNVTKGWLP